MLLRKQILLVDCLMSLSCVYGKWIEGRLDTKDNWAFLARFCFLSFEGQFEYFIEFDREHGIPNLLLYYDDESQWPSVYHSSKTCKEKEAVLNRVGQNQIIRLSYWYPDTEYTGCVMRKADKELPASKRTSTTLYPATKTAKTKSTAAPPLNSSYYDQFLKTTKMPKPNIEAPTNSTAWYEIFATDDYNSTTTEIPEDSLWENIGPETNVSRNENLKDVEIMFENNAKGKDIIKRSTFEHREGFGRRGLKADYEANFFPSKSVDTDRYVVRCHNARRFRSARERWWFIAISNCDSDKGLDVKYKFLMTNGPEGDFWHQHFSADEFSKSSGNWSKIIAINKQHTEDTIVKKHASADFAWKPDVLPVLLTYAITYVVVMIAVVMCSVELKSRHLLHTTYKLFLMSIVSQHVGVTLRVIAYAKYAINGRGGEGARVFGEFLCGVSEMTYLLLLILMAKGYTITRARLKTSFTVMLTVFMCTYCLIYVTLFIYQAKEFDPGEVVYLYESPAGYGIIVLRTVGWCVFAYATFFTCKKFPAKNVFYCPFFICGTLWFFAGPLFILTANNYIDKWVRESVVVAVLLFITFMGHVSFLLLTLPVFANKNFPYHVKTSQIGVLELRNDSTLDNFGNNAYHPNNGTSHTVIIPLTRRTEELIGNMYQQYMASAPPLSIEHESANKQNGVSKPLEPISMDTRSVVKQDSTDTNDSEDIKPMVNNRPIFTVENQIPILERASSLENNAMNIMRPRRNILEPIKREEIQPPAWCLARGREDRWSKRKLRTIEMEEDVQESSKSNDEVVTPNRPAQTSTETNHSNNPTNESIVNLFTITKN
ncbi:Transmembrane protein 145 [Eumeta japonica]|uniref:Transmembrane protein 145 n=1 Tax=Eumeta variegata TaxID=151549 RepID=A0A4C1VUU0_EUMVA|nr:Transmembrane protein 145 [Eumeta japonica]